MEEKTMRISSDSRIAYFDNLRFLLIALVVVGHFLEISIEHSDIFKAALLWIYSFHMPLFLFVSGVFYTNRKPLQKASGLLMIGCLLQILLFVEHRLLDGEATLSFSIISNVPWYMFALAVYLLLTSLLKEIDKRFLLAFSIMLAVFAGYDDSIGHTFALSRTIVFYPFFLLGSMTGKDKVLQTIRRKEWKLLAIAVFLAWGAICVFRLDDVYDLLRLFRASQAFGKFPAFKVWGGLYRILCYVISMAVGFAVMCLVPQRRLPVMTEFGKRTLQVYFWHQLVRDVVGKTKLAALLCTTPAGKIAWLLLAAGLTFLLSCRAFGFPTQCIMSASHRCEAERMQNKAE